MSEVCAYDIDGTIRDGSLLGDAIVHGIAAGYFDPSKYVDPQHPTYAEVTTFVAEVTGKSHGHFRELTDWLADNAVSQTMPWALQRLDEQHRQGMHRILISHSPDFIVKAFARGLGVHHAYGSYFHTQQLVFSGHAVERNKVQAVKRYAKRHGLNGLAFAAGDTVSDVPMLEMARYAVIVNPNEQLGSLALQRHWEIIRTSTHKETTA